MDTLLEIRPIEKVKWHKKSGKESFTRPIRLHALVDPFLMQYETGLTEKELKKFSEELKTDLTPVFRPEESHPFWDSKSATVLLENNTQFLNLSNTYEYIRSRICKASKYVANSLKEYQEGKFPDATHVIIDEREEVEAKATKVATKQKAYVEAAKLSKDRKISIILIMTGDKNLRGKSDDFIEVAFADLIERDADTVLRHITMSKEDVMLHAMILEALQKYYLKKAGHKILYADSVIGSDIHDVIDYFKKDENNELKLRIMAQINE